MDAIKASRRASLQTVAGMPFDRLIASSNALDYHYFGWPAMPIADRNSCGTIRTHREELQLVFNQTEDKK